MAGVVVLLVLAPMAVRSLSLVSGPLIPFGDGGHRDVIEAGTTSYRRADSINHVGP